MHFSPRVLPILLCAAIACGGDSGPTPGDSVGTDVTDAQR